MPAIGAPFLLENAGRPSDPALVDGETGRTWSYEQVRAHSADLAGRLRSESRVLVAWVSRSSPESVIGYLAALESRNPVLPIPSGWDPPQTERLFEAYEPEILLEQTGISPPPTVAASYDPWLSLGGVTAWRRTTGPSPHGDIHDDLGLLLSTSGSTGSAKMVRLTRRNLVSNARGIARALDIAADERAVTTLPLSYSFGLSVLHSYLWAGASLLLTERSVIDEEFWSTVAKRGGTSMAGVPYTFGLLQRIGFRDRAPESIRTLQQAGGKMSDELIAHYAATMRDRNGRLFVMYGQTEATARISVLPPELIGEKLGSVGRPLEGGKLEIEHRDPDRQGKWRSGEIVYHGPNVMMGYAELREDLSRGDEQRGTLLTGDLGYLDGDGYLYITARAKRIAKVFGVRVSLDDIEAKLTTTGPAAAVSSHDGVTVFTTPDRSSSIRAAIRDMAAEMRMHPSGFSVATVDSLPLLPNGKVDYSSLQEASMVDGSTPRPSSQDPPC